MKNHTDQATRSLFTTEARKPAALCSLQFVGSILVVVGFFGPWIGHATAGLTVTGYELSEFAKFFPQVRGGAVPIRRALFITPLLAGVLSLALVIRRSRLGPFWRFAATALAALLLLVVLPPLQAVLEPQYRLQLILVVGAFLLSLVTPLSRQVSERIRGVLILLLVLIGLAPAAWQAVLFRPLVTTLYGHPIWPGWGVIVCAVGFLVLLVSGLRRAFGT